MNNISEVAKKFENHTLTQDVAGGVSKVISLVKKGNSPLCDGVMISVWPHHLCFSGAYGTYVFKSSTCLDLTKLFNSSTASFGYLSEKLVNPETAIDENGLTENFKQACRTIKMILERE